MLILLPPSEGKQHGGHMNGEQRCADFDKPLDIARGSTEKELKCTGTRYNEGIDLNHHVDKGPRMPAIERYNGIMYQAINYPGLSDDGQIFFDTHVRILSGMYGILRPQDQIANYKLPVTTPLKHFWKDTLTSYLNDIEDDIIVDLLPGAYRQMINRKSIHAHVTSVERCTADGHKVAHGVKNIKGKWLHRLCKQRGQGYDRSEEVVRFVV